MPPTPSDTSITIETLLRRSEKVLFSEIDADKVMIDIDRGLYFGLNSVGADIWDLLSSPQTPANIIAVLEKSYDVSPEICRQETMALLESLLHANLVEIVS
jgi:hypothetical protein